MTRRAASRMSLRGYIMRNVAVDCQAVDPCIPTLPGRNTSGFHPPGKHCLREARSAKRGEVSVEFHEV